MHGVYVDHSNMRLRPKGNFLWRWWWPLGGVALLGLIASGMTLGWSANLWAGAGLVAVVYVGVPVMAANLYDLAGSKSQSGNHPEAALGSDYGMAAVDQQTLAPNVDATDIEKIGQHGVGGHGTQSAANAGAEAEVGTEHSRATPVPPSSEGLQQRIAAMGEATNQPLASPNDRSWRRVGSAQFAALVESLGAALPSINIADDTADLAGVTRHLIRKGRDSPKQRWQSVLEQALDDRADDVVCSEALKLTRSEQLRAAVADWIGGSGD